MAVAPREDAMQAAGLERRDLFGTPIAVTLMPNAQAINAALRAEVLALHEAAADKDPTLAWDSAAGLPDPAGAAMGDLIGAALLLVAGITGRREDEAPENWAIAPRCHVLGQGQSVAVHSHPGVAWEATYFVATSGQAPGGPGGELEFQDPRGEAPVMYAPDLTFLMPDGATLGISRNLAAKPGVLVVYPAWLLHAVNFYRADGLRLSVTLQLTPKATMGVRT